MEDYLVRGLDLVRVVFLFVLVVAAAYTDLVHGKVYNGFTYTGILLGLLISLAVGKPAELAGGTPSPASSVVGLLLGSGVFYLAHIYGGVGMGDVKLMGAIGALTGWRFALVATFYSALAGAFLSIGVLVYRKRLLDGLKNAFLALFAPGRLKDRKHVDGTPAVTGITIPFGFATAIGTLVAYARLALGGNHALF
jgi:Flp pilus assembly protein protease CpaA